MTRIIRTLLTCVAVLAPCTVRAADIPDSSIQVGKWVGQGYTNDQTGSFSHCTVSTVYMNGNTLFLNVFSDGVFGVAISNEALKKIGTKLKAEIQVDNKPKQIGTFEIFAQSLGRFSVPNNVQLKNDIGRGNTLFVTTEDGSTAAFHLNDTFRAIDALSRCYRTNIAYRSAGSATPPTVAGQSDYERAYNANINLGHATATFIALNRDWWNIDQQKTAHIMGVHRDLIARGVVPNNESVTGHYWEEIIFAANQYKNQTPQVAAEPPKPQLHQPAVAPSKMPKLTFKPSGKRADRYDIAIIIGNSDYESQGNKIPNVTPAVNDAQLMKDYIKAALGIDEQNIIYVENATAGKLLAIFGSADNHKGQAHNWVRPDQSNVYVYYSGHGAPSVNSGQGLIVPVDADPNNLDLTGYPLDTLYNNLSKLPAKSIQVMIDACFSGVSQAGTILRHASPIGIQVNEPEIPNNLTVFASTSKGQVSSWTESGDYSLFTYTMLDAISGKADMNRDGEVEPNELKSYVSEEVEYLSRRLYGREQSPTFHNF